MKITIEDLKREKKNGLLSLTQYLTSLNKEEYISAIKLIEKDTLELETNIFTILGILTIYFTFITIFITLMVIFIHWTIN